MIYFMQSVEGGSIKIGHSANVDLRRQQLEQTYGTPLAVLATMDGGKMEERALHARFSHLRFGRTEQFRPASDLMLFIGRPLLVDQNADAVEAMPADVTTVAVRCTARYKKWTKDFAREQLVTPSQLVAIALKALAESRNFKLPPDR